MPGGALRAMVLRSVRRSVSALVAVTATAVAGCAAPPPDAPAAAADARPAKVTLVSAAVASIPAPPPTPHPKAAAPRANVHQVLMPPRAASRPNLHGSGHDGVCAS